MFLTQYFSVDSIPESVLHIAVRWVKLVRWVKWISIQYRNLVWENENNIDNQRVYAFGRPSTGPQLDGLSLTWLYVWTRTKIKKKLVGTRVESRDAQNAKRLGLKSFCSHLDTTEAFKLSRI